MPITHRILLVRGHEPIVCVDPDGLEQRIQRQGLTGSSDHEVAVDELMQPNRHLALVQALIRADRGDLVDRHRSEKDRQSTKEESTRFVEQLVAPIDRTFQCPLATNSSAAPCEQRHAVAEVGQQLTGRQVGRLARREFDRERQAVQTGTDLADRGPLDSIEVEGRVQEPRSRHEQIDSVGRGIQRPEREDLLAVDLE